MRKTLFAVTLSLAVLPTIAAAPAEVQPFGTPSSRRVECLQLEDFAKRLIALRDLGIPENEAIGMMIGGAVVAQTQTDPELLMARSRILWSVAGTPADIAAAAFTLCMQKEMS